MFDLLGRLQRSATIALLISPAGILIIAATRLLIISDYNTATAAAIVTSDGYVNTLLGTVLPVVQVFMPYVALVLLFFRRLIPSLLAFLAAALISPMAFAKGTAGGIARSDALAVWDWISHHWWIYPVLLIAAASLVLELAGFGISQFMRTVGVVASLALAVFVIRVYPFPLTDSYYLSIIKQPWLPAETITLTSGSQVVGYSLFSGNLSLEVLKEQDRTIEFIPNGTVARQQVCQLGTSRAGVPLLTFTAAPARIPRCASRSRPAGPATREGK